MPLGIALAIRLIPPAVLAEHRVEAAQRLSENPPRRSWAGAAIVMAVWLTALLWISSTLWNLVL